MSATSRSSIHYKCKHNGLLAHDLDSRCSRARAMNMFENRKLQGTIYKLSKKYNKKVERLKRETYELKYILKQMPPAPPPSMHSDYATTVTNRGLADRRVSVSAGPVLTTTLAAKPAKNCPVILTPRSAPTATQKRRRKPAIVPGTPNAVCPPSHHHARGELPALDRHSAIQINIEHLRRVAARAAERRETAPSDDSQSECSDPDATSPGNPPRINTKGPRTLAERRLSFLQKLDEARKRRKQSSFAQSSDDGNEDTEDEEGKPTLSGDVKSVIGATNQVRRMSLLLPPTNTYDFVSRRRISLQLPNPSEDVYEKEDRPNGNFKKTVRINHTAESIEYEALTPRPSEASTNLLEWSRAVAGRRRESLGFSSYGLDDDHVRGNGAAPRKRRFSAASSVAVDDSDDDETLPRKGQNSRGFEARRNSLSQASMARRISLQQANKPSATYHLEKRLRSMQRRLSTAQPASYAELSKVSLKDEMEPEPEIQWPRKEKERAALILENEADEQVVLKSRVKAFLERAKQIPKPHSRLSMTKSEHDMKQFQQAMRQLEIT